MCHYVSLTELKVTVCLLQMENVEFFLKACVEYGMQTIDTFQVKELYESRAVYTVSPRTTVDR